MSKTNNKLRIWSDTLNEQAFYENVDRLDQISINNSQTSARGVESYRYESTKLTAPSVPPADAEQNENIKKSPKKKRSRNNKNKRPPIYLNHNQLILKNLDPSQLRLANVKNSNSEAPKSANLKDRIGSRVTFDENKSRPHIKVTELDTEESVAREIAKHLNEPKHQVILKCVQVLGKKKALELLYATEDIQKTGGMLTQSGDRRRSSGGVFFQLIKKDETILNCQRTQIFSVDVEKKKSSKSTKRLRKRALNSSKQSQSNTSTESAAADSAPNAEADNRNENNDSEIPSNEDTNEVANESAIEETVEQNNLNITENDAMNEINENELIQFDE